MLNFSWETARNPDRPSVFVKGADGHLVIPGFHWCIVKLGHSMTPTKIEIDTAHFKGNFPETCTVEGIYSPTDVPGIDALWMPLLERTKLLADNLVEFKVNATSNITHVKLTIRPDGGISRLRVFGHIAI